MEQINLGTIYATMELRDQKFQQQLNEISSQIKKSSDSVVSGVSGMGMQLSNAFGQVASSIASVLKPAAILATTGSIGIGAMAKAAIQQQIAVENAGFALKAYEKDASKVNTVLSDLVKYATSPMGTLFQREELFKAATNLKVFGDNTSSLTNHVKIMSKAVALGYTTFDELSFILGRVGSQGQLTGLDFDMLTQRGIKLPDSMRNAKVSFEELFQAMDNAVPWEVLNGRANSVEGRMIQLKSAFRNLGKEILGIDGATNTFIKGGFGDQLMKLLERLRIVLSSSEIKEGFRKMGTQLGELATKALPPFISAIKILLKSTPELINLTIALSAAWAAMKVGQLASSIAVYVRGLLALVGVLPPATAGTWGFNAALDANPVMLIVTAIAALVAALVFLQLKFNIFGKAWVKLRPILEPVIQIFKDLWEGLFRLAGLIMNELRPAIDFMKDNWQTLAKIVGIVLAPAFIPLILTVKLLTIAIKVMNEHWEGTKKIILIILKVVFAPLYLAFYTATQILSAFGLDWADVWNGIKTTIDRAWAFISKTMEHLNKAWDKIVQSSRDTKVAMEEALSYISDKFDTIKGSIESVVRNFEQFKNSVKTTFGKAKDTVSEFSQSVQTKFSEITSTTQEWIELFKNGFDGDIGTDKLVDKLNGLKDRLNSFSEGILSRWAGGFEQMKQTVSNFGGSVGGSLGGIWDGLVTGASNAINSVVGFFTGLPNRISTTLSGIWDGIQSILSSLWDGLTTGLSNAWNNIQQFFVDFPTNLSNAFESVYTSISTFFANLPSRLFSSQKESGEQSANNVVTGIKEKMGTMETIRKVGDALLGLIVAAIGAVLAYIVDAAVRFGISIISGLVNGIVSMAGAVWGGIKSVADQIGQFFAGVGSWLYDSGKALFEGFIAGMKSIKNKVRDTASDIVKSVRNLLPFSPAKEGPFSGKGWTLYSGKSLMEGLAQGIYNSANVPAEAMRKAMSGLNTPVTANIGGVSAQSINSPISIYGDITIGSESDADYLMQRLSNRQDLTMKGLAGI